MDNPFIKSVETDEIELLDLLLPMSLMVNMTIESVQNCPGSWQQAVSSDRCVYGYE